MTIVLKNPSIDMYGNSKNNIFLAYHDDGQFLGHAYVYPNLNQSQIMEIPYLIFIGIHVEKSLDRHLRNQTRQVLFDQIFLRAKEIRQERPDLKARIYSGFEYDQEQMDFYLHQGFAADYSLIMEADIRNEIPAGYPNHISFKQIHMENAEERNDYVRLYDHLFISPLDPDQLLEQSQKSCFQSVYVLVNGVVCGGCTFFKKGDIGHIETMFVIPEFRGKGIAKYIMNYSLNELIGHGVTRFGLEVWALNKIAVNLYKSYGFIEIRKNLMFPGVT